MRLYRINFILLFFLVVSLPAKANEFDTYAIDSDTYVGSYGIDIALNSSGQPGICYFAQTAGDLKFTTFNGTSWTTETVDNSSTMIGSNCAIIYDNSDNPNIVYLDVTNQDLLHIVKQGESWSKKTIDSNIRIDIPVIVPAAYHKLSR